MNRRAILGGLLAAPAIIRSPGLLMRIRPLLVAPAEATGLWGNIEIHQTAKGCERMLDRWLGAIHLNTFTVDAEGVCINGESIEFQWA